MPKFVGNHSGPSVNIRLDTYTFTGMQIYIDRLGESGQSFNRSELIRDGIRLILKKHGIKDSDVRAELKKRKSE